MTKKPPPLGAVLLAFAAVYLIWGSTYLAIRLAIETMPPLLMAAARFLTAGAVLYTWLSLRGSARPSLDQWKTAGVSGALLLAGGNSAVVVAEQWVPSGLTALLVGLVPIWMVLLDWRFGARTCPTGRSIVGLALGLVGVGVLAGSPGVGAGGRQEVFGALLILAGSLSWAAGSIYTRYATSLPAPAMLVSMQMLAGGTIQLVMAVALGEPALLDIRSISGTSWAALAYLIVFGALIAYGAYIWLLTVVTPARSATYAYVNPVVAMFLGWALVDEPLTYRSLLAAAIILGAVGMITTGAPSSLESGVRPVPSGGGSSQ